MILALAAFLGSAQLETSLARIAEEAEVFRQAAPKMIAQETLRQRARRAPPRFRPRIGAAATKPPKPQYQTREIVSEYSFASLRESPEAIHELRQVLSVDGRRIATQEKARQRLVAGIRSEDDRVKKRMLEEFERFGLTGAAADFGQLILLFTKRRLPNYEFTPGGTGRIGAEEAAIISFRQTGGAEGLTIFEKRQALHEPLQGQIWVRRADGLPLRIVLNASRKQDNVVVRDEATVDYAMSPHGSMVPVSVVRRRFAGNELLVEDVSQYSAFRKFSAEAEIKFQ